MPQYCLVLFSVISSYKRHAGRDISNIFTSLLQITTWRECQKATAIHCKRYKPLSRLYIARLILISNRQHVQYEYPPLGETAAESSMGVGVGVEGETGAEVSVIMGGASLGFPTKF